MKNSICINRKFFFIFLLAISLFIFFILNKKLLTEKKTTSTKAATPKPKISSLAQFRNNTIAKNPRLKRFLQIQGEKKVVKVAIVPFELQDTDYLRANLFSGFENEIGNIFKKEDPNSLPNIISTISYGKIEIIYKIFDKVKIKNSIFEPHPKIKKVGNFEEWGMQAYLKNKDELDTYDYVQFVFPAEDKIGFYKDGQPLPAMAYGLEFSYINANKLYSPYIKQIFTHELLHTFGLISDSISLNCNNTLISKNCPSSDYEKFGIMGKHLNGDINGISKFLLGWIDESEIKDFNQSKSAEFIYSLEQRKNVSLPKIFGIDNNKLHEYFTYPRILKIKKNDSNEFYFIEYRNKISKFSIESEHLY